TDLDLLTIATGNSLRLSLEPKTPVDAAIAQADWSQQPTPQPSTDPVRLSPIVQPRTISAHPGDGWAHVNLANTGRSVSKGAVSGSDFSDYDEFGQVNGSTGTGGGSGKEKGKIPEVVDLALLDELHLERYGENERCRVGKKRCHNPGGAYQTAQSVRDGQSGMREKPDSDLTLGKLLVGWSRELIVLREETRMEIADPSAQDGTELTGRALPFPASLFRDDPQSFDTAAVPSLVNIYAISKSESMRPPSESKRDSEGQFHSEILGTSPTTPTVESKATPGTVGNNGQLAFARTGSQAVDAADNAAEAVVALTGNTMTVDTKEPVKCEFRFKMPDLAFNQFRRKRLLEWEAKTPGAPHTRIIYADFLHKHPRVRRSFTDLLAAVGVDTPPPAAAETKLDSKANRKKKEPVIRWMTPSLIFNKRLTRSLFRGPSTNGPRHNSSKSTAANYSSVYTLHSISRQVAVGNAPRTKPSDATDPGAGRSTSGHPASLGLHNNQQSARVTSKSALETLASSDTLASKGSLISMEPVAPKHRTFLNVAYAAVSQERRRVRIIQPINPDTPSHRQTSARIDSLHSALVRTAESYAKRVGNNVNPAELVPSRETLARAIHAPQEIAKPLVVPQLTLKAMGHSRLAATTAAPTTVSSRKGTKSCDDDSADDDDEIDAFALQNRRTTAAVLAEYIKKSTRKSPRGKGLLPVHKIAVVPKNDFYYAHHAAAGPRSAHHALIDEDNEFAVHIAKTDSWWTTAEYRRLRSEWAERKVIKKLTTTQKSDEKPFYSFVQGRAATPSSNTKYTHDPNHWLLNGGKSGDRTSDSSVNWFPAGTPTLKESVPKISTAPIPDMRVVISKETMHIQQPYSRYKPNML
ncbi:hypothetical protein HDU82_003014, partial [Entophlyctis luteolus]